MQRESLKNRWLALGHFVIVALGWLLFAWGWVLVARGDERYRQLLWVMAATLVVSPLVTTYWIVHTLAIFHAKGERRGGSHAEAHYERDWNGVPVIADWQSLAQARITVVEPLEGAKRFRQLLAGSKADGGEPYLSPQPTEAPA